MLVLYQILKKMSIFAKHSFVPTKKPRPKPRFPLIPSCFQVPTKIGMQAPYTSKYIQPTKTQMLATVQGQLTHLKFCRKHFYLQTKT